MKTKLTKKVTLIIVNWNGMSFLPKCLQSLKKQYFTNFHLIVVDNGSCDGSVEFVENKYPDIEIISLSQNHGFSIANNLAIKKVTTPYTGLLNNDTYADPRWLQHLFKALEDYPKAGFAASKMLLYDAPNLIDRVGDAYTRSGTGMLRGRGSDKKSYEKTEWVFGACAGAALYRTEMFKDIGFFDEDFWLLYEDVDLSFRAQLKGYKCIYVPEAIVYHKASMSIKNDSDISVYYSHRNLEWVYFQNMPARLIIKTLVNHFLYNILALCFFFFSGKHIQFIKAKKDALKGLKIALKKRLMVQNDKRVDDEYIWQLFEKENFSHRYIRRLKTQRSA